MALPGAIAAFAAFRSTEPPRGLGDLLDANKLRVALERGDATVVATEAEAIRQAQEQAGGSVPRRETGMAPAFFWAGPLSAAYRLR